MIFTILALNYYWFAIGRFGFCFNLSFSANLVRITQTVMLPVIQVNSCLINYQISYFGSMVIL